MIRFRRRKVDLCLVLANGERLPIPGSYPLAHLVRAALR